MHKLLTWLMLSLPLAAAPRALFYMTDRPESIRSFLEHASNIAIPASSPSGPNRLAAAGGGGADGTGSDLGLANPICIAPGSYTWSWRGASGPKWPHRQ